MNAPCSIDTNLYLELPLFLYTFISIFFHHHHFLADIKVLSADESKLARTNEFNFDSPDAFDFDLLAETIAKLRDGKRVDVPIYNFVTHSREKRTVISYSSSSKLIVIILFLILFLFFCS